MIALQRVVVDNQRVLRQEEELRKDAVYKWVLY
jgi:hypothetical protein